MASTDRNVLRAAVAELIGFPGTEARVIIDEAVSIGADPYSGALARFRRAEARGPARAEALVDAQQARADCQASGTACRDQLLPKIDAWLDDARG